MKATVFVGKLARDAYQSLCLVMFNTYKLVINICQYLPDRHAKSSFPLTLSHAPFYPTVTTNVNSSSTAETRMG